MENNIDKLFKNKLSKHQESPSEEAWAKLEEALHGKQIKRRSLVAYWQVAAAVALLLTASFFYFNQEEKTQEIVKNNDTQVVLPQIQGTEKEEVKTYQPIEIQQQSKPEQMKTLVSAKKQPKEKIQADKATNNSKHEKQVEITNVIQAEEAVALNQPNENVTPTTAVEEIRVTMKFADDTETAAAVQEDEEEMPEKKSWISKLVSNIKKKRQKEHQAKEGNVEEEKASFSVFGIDTEKVFAKRKTE